MNPASRTGSSSTSTLTRSKKLLSNPAILLATVFGAGLSKKAPGTVGSFVGVLLFIPLAKVDPFLQMLAVLFVFVLSLWATESMERVTGKHDDQRIVIDELVGVWIPLVALPFSFYWYAAAFGLFRLFDILKPQPAKYFDEHLPGAFGVVLDDVMAGIYALAILQLVLHFGVFS